MLISKPEHQPRWCDTWIPWSVVRCVVGGCNVTRWPFQRSKQIASKKQVKRKIGQSSTNRCIFVGICWQNPWRLAIFMLKIIPWVFRFCLALDDPVESYEKQCGKSRCWRWKVFFSNKLMRIGNALWILFRVARFFVGGGFQFYMFIPNPTWGKDFHFDEHIFSNGLKRWNNQRL